MSSSRTKCVSTKLTEAEYATLARAAGAQTLSVWARAVLLDAAVPTRLEREAGERRDTPDRSALPRTVAARGDDAGGGYLDPPTEDRVRPPTEDRVGPPAEDRVALAADRPPSYPTVIVDWRSGATDRSFWDPDRTANRTLTRSSAWIPAMLVIACISAVGIGAYRYTRIWTPLQRQYLFSYVWSAVAITGNGSYELLTIVDQTERRTALDADVLPVVPTKGGDTFALTATAVSRGAVRLAWQRGEWDHAALHAFLRHGIYQDQTLLDLARPALWGALAVLMAALVPVVSDEIAWAVMRRARRAARSAWEH